MFILIMMTRGVVAFLVHTYNFCIQGDHSPDNVKFPDNSMTFP